MTGGSGRNICRIPIPRGVKLYKTKQCFHNAARSNYRPNLAHRPNIGNRKYENNTGLYNCKSKPERHTCYNTSSKRTISSSSYLDFSFLSNWSTLTEKTKLDFKSSRYADRGAPCICLRTINYINRLIPTINRKLQLHIVAHLKGIGWEP